MKSTRLSTLQLEQCSVTEDNLDLLFTDSVFLKYLGITNMGITLEKKDLDKDYHSLTRLLSSKQCKIQTLQLNGNNIAVKGSLVLAQGLCMNKSLRILDLSRNSLGPKGAYLLCDALREKGVSVKSLDLSYNEVGNLGAKSIGRLVEQKSLLELRIQGNKISCEGMNILFDKLTSSTIKILDMSQNIMQIGVLHQFRLFIEQNKEMNALSINGLFFFNERAFDSICTSLKRNRGL